MPRATGQHVAKRHVEVPAGRAAADVEKFYATRSHREATGDVPHHLRRPRGHRHAARRPPPATAKAAQAAANKVECRLSKGEKRNREHLA